VPALRHDLLLLRQALPISFSYMAPQLMMFIDIAMLGRVGALELAAVGFAGTILVFIKVVARGMSIGVAPLVARCEGQAGPTNRKLLYLTNSIYVAIIAAAFSALCLWILITHLERLGQAPNVNRVALPYIMLMSYSVFPTTIYYTLRYYCEASHSAVVPMTVAFTGLLLKGMLNALLIFGLLGFPQWGIIGAAVGSLIAETSMALMLAIYVYRRERGKSLHHLPLIPQLRLMADISRVGFPVTTQAIIEVGAFSAAGIMIGWLGHLPLASHQITLNLAALAYTLPLGVAQATSIYIGREASYKAGEARLVGLRSLRLTMMLMTGIGGFFLLSSNLLPQLYTDNLVLQETAASLVVIMALFQVAEGLQAVATGALRGLLDVNIPTLFNLTCWWALSLPTAYFLAFTMGHGAQGVWYGLAVGSASAAILLTHRFSSLLKTV
jgi:MATE family multidrug resistance protein